MSENKKTLHDILKNFQEIEMELIESGGEIDEKIEILLSINESQLNDKLDGYEKFSRYLKGQIEYLKNMEEHYTKRRKILENSIRRCRESMLLALTTTDNKSIKTKEFNFSIGKTEKWNIDPSLIPNVEKDDLIKHGHAENLFKIHINELKNIYKDKNEKIPDWINIQESLFIRVS